ncbi:MULTISPECIES: EamA family transporter [Brevibacterium]|uniref:DMT family transporter n=1 Tax=Brevibacterium picturae TaxID=260553 RepID=A0ABP4MC74_9MICO|nr:EamA family transporter [Brevibacterium atlanticum]
MLGIVAAVLFGASHFLNGVLSRRVPAMNVAVCSQTGGAVLFLIWALLTWESWPDGTDVVWAGVSGAGAGMGVGALYEGMHACRISVVVPVTSIVSVAVPFLLSVLVLGDHVDGRLIVAALLLVPATWLLSRPINTPRTAPTAGNPPSTPVSAPAAAQDRSSANVTAVVYGLIAGLGYATQLFALSRITSTEPASPMLISQLVSIVPLLLMLRTGSGRFWPFGATTSLSKATMIGGLAALAMISYLYATREAALAPVMIAIALYPALPVLLALLVLKERLSGPQVIGLAITALVLPLINIAG